MSKLLIAAAASIAALAAGSASAGTVKARAFDPLTAGYTPRTGAICIRSGWGIATIQSGRPVNKGDCRSQSDWSRRGLTFDMPPATPTVEVAAR